ncbi:hypothetical protein AB7W07_22110 [Providencia rettgeri]
MKKIITVALFAASASALSAPPPNPTVFNLSVQTEDVNSALEHATKNIPVLDKGKKYEVRVEVRELQPYPKEHEAGVLRPIHRKVPYKPISTLNS